NIGNSLNPQPIKQNTYVVFASNFYYRLWVYEKLIHEAKCFALKRETYLQLERPFIPAEKGREFSLSISNL
ncbi:hypothetical protein, partial [Pseudomonas sp. 21C1]|uniref:hypothetical protein n=1 Tax=Pseudomonas sp. 21C1 TaxID=1843690 RepID=UPI001C45744C